MLSKRNAIGENELKKKTYLSIFFKVEKKFYDIFNLKLKLSPKLNPATANVHSHSQCPYSCYRANSASCDGSETVVQP
jgi:hypothetical protein